MSYIISAWADHNPRYRVLNNNVNMKVNDHQLDTNKLNILPQLESGHYYILSYRVKITNKKQNGRPVNMSLHTIMIQQCPSTGPILVIILIILV